MSADCTFDDVKELPVAPHLGIGIFDSGSGGMVTAGFVARMLDEADLQASTVFFGDTKHLPYGTRTEQEVAGFSDRIIRKPAPTCPVVGIACNTASAAWTHHGVVGKDAAGPRVFSVVQVAAEESYARAHVSSGVELAAGRRAKVIGVLGTHLTAQIQSHAERILAMFRDDVSRIVGHELPMVPYAFGPAGPRPTGPADLIDFARTPHINARRHACFGFSGDPPPVAMFRSLGLKRIARVASLADASG